MTNRVKKKKKKKKKVSIFNCSPKLYFRPKRSSSVTLELAIDWWRLRNSSKWREEVQEEPLTWLPENSPSLSSEKLNSVSWLSSEKSEIFLSNFFLNLSQSFRCWFSFSLITLFVSFPSKSHMLNQNNRASFCKFLLLRSQLINFLSTKCQTIH